MSKTRPQEKSKDGGLNAQLWQAPSWTVSHLKATELPEEHKNQGTISFPGAAPSQPVETAAGRYRDGKTPSLDPPSLHNPNHPKSGPLYLNTNSRSAAHPQPLYEGAGGGQQHASDTYPWKATTFYRLKN